METIGTTYIYDIYLLLCWPTVTDVTDGRLTFSSFPGRFPVGMFSEGCFVLCEGSYDDNVFTCSVMGFPPAEDAETFR